MDQLHINGPERFNLKHIKRERNFKKEHIKTILNQKVILPRVEDNMGYV